MAGGGTLSTCHCGLEDHTPDCPLAKETPIPTMPRRERGKCVVSHFTSGPCRECGAFQKHPHVTRDLKDEGGNLKTVPRLHCKCDCPVCVCECPACVAKREKEKREAKKGVAA